ncbi:hypothetical protein EDC14_104216 [Hydrogenispora ethanolica]|uniref:GyrI-like small molecule binding domain-containing protein n=1 Tax=Hydrogenispora ethanolica TaxID=1082276 RepID=A0A4R1QZA5_HYDET|nr:GyrI-like domain-containing protein [Hydrogenispora ethanolica]TCL58323.1 hypothetical protein EDC14_104216 [Hydrogenispora ethanolica]
MGKIDLKKELQTFYNPSAGTVQIVRLPALRFLIIDGRGDPNTAPAYREAVAALFGLSYTLKFMLKREGGADYGVMPLEGLWWTGNPADYADFSPDHKELWQWTALMLQPDCIDPERVERARSELHRKKDLPALDRVRLERFEEGLAAQILHLGPYADEAPTIDRLHRFIAENGYRRTGKHHEIYLNDPRRTAPGRLKTILRQPIAAGGN